MSYAGKLDLKLKARKLRKQGWSIKAIEKELTVSRSSVSLWVRDIKLTKKQFDRLYLNKKTGQLKGSIIAAMNKMKAREEITAKLMKQGKKEVGRLSKRDRFIAGVALYCGEGAKRDSSVMFSNSNPELISFMMGWLRDFCRVAESRFRGALYIHDNLDKNKSKQFWAGLTGIPLSQFTKTYIVKNNPNRLRKVKHINGVFRITVSDVNLHRKVMGWMSGIMT